MPDLSELQQLAQRVVAKATAGEQVEAFVARSRGVEVKVYEGDVESLTSDQTAGIGVRIIRDGRVGVAHAGVLDADVIDEIVAEARDNAAFGTPDEYAALAEPDGISPVLLDLWSKDVEATTTAEKVALALELERRVLATDPRIRSVPSAAYSDGLIEAAVATSTGIDATYSGTTCGAWAEAIAEDGDDTQTGWGWSIGRGFGDLDLDEAASEAGKKATRLLGATKPETGRVTVVLDPIVTATFLSILSSTLNGESVLKGRSLFADRLGDEVGAGMFTLVDDPTNPLSHGAASHDAEGLATRRNVLIEDGVLKMFLYDTYTARRAGTAGTGSAVRGGHAGVPYPGARALSLVPGESTPGQIISTIDDGILIFSISGVHSGVNTVSGDVSVGAEGIRIRNGQLAEPVREFTIASTIQRMLQRVRAVGNDLRWLPSSSSGLTLAIDEVSVSGV